jgi:hypothetical protein
MFIECPHCGGLVEILEINCGIFRHGIYKNKMEQINPHAPKILCDNITEQNLIYGCGKPFQLIKKSEIYLTKKCDYI